MKTGFFYGVFAGFILGCIFFFGVTTVRGQGETGRDDGQRVGYYHSIGTGGTLAYGGPHGSGGSAGTKGEVYGAGGNYTVGGPGYLRGGDIG